MAEINFFSQFIVVNVVMICHSAKVTRLSICRIGLVTIS